MPDRAAAQQQRGPDRQHPGAVDPEADWQEQIRQAVGAYVDHIASRPAITLSWIREAPALGAMALPLHRLAMERLTDMLVDLSDSPGFRRAQICRRSPGRWR